ncbi:MAG: hypothetical protein AAF618_00080 [Pseudomonadota bacterium]
MSGLTLEEARKLAGDEGREALTVPACLWPAVRLAREARDRFVFIGGGFARPYASGFDLTALETIARFIGVEITREVWDDLAVLEAHAKTQINRGAD